MRIWWLVVMSCGGAAPAPVAKPVGNAPPPAPAFTCATATNMLVDDGLPPDQRLAMRHDLEDACTTDRWPAAYIECASHNSAKCTDTRTPEQIAHATAILTPPSDLPKSCADYIRAIEELAKCEKIPQESRDGMLQGVAAMKAAWHFSDLPPDARKAALDAASTACAQGVEALDQGARTSGCK